MKNKYFEINVQQEDYKFSSEFELLEVTNNDVIAEDGCGNSVIIKQDSIYVFIHDAPLNKDYIKLFDSRDDFNSNTFFYDEIEQNNRYNTFIQAHPSDDSIPEKSILVSIFVSKMGGKRIISKYKEGAYYNITQAYLDGTLTKEEFNNLLFL